MTEKYDAIIIGAGIGGLACGSLLARQGVKVMIIEQHSIPGGFCTSYNKNGYSFDVPVVMTGMGAGFPDRQLLSFIGIEDNLEFIKIDRLATIIGPGLNLDWHADLNALKEEFSRIFPQESENLREYFYEIELIYAEILAAHYKPNFWQRLTYPLKFPKLVKYQNDTFDSFVSRFTENEKLKDLLGKEAITLGLCNKEISALVYVGMVMAYAKGGIWFPKGGFQQIPDQISECFKSYGGELKLKSKVNKILIKNKQAVGVELDSQERIYANYVISNADSKKTFLELIGQEELSIKLFKKITNAQQSFSGFVVKLAVKMDLSAWENLGWVLYFPEYGNTEKMVDLAKEKKNDIENCSFSIDTAALSDKTNKPEGIGIISLVVLPVAYNFNEQWQVNDKEKYLQLKETLADKLITRAEKLLPGLSKNIVAKDISTPRTYERYTSASEGGWYDLAMNTDNSLSNRMGPNTEIKGLFLTGAKSITGPGLNTSMFAGLYTADTILKGKLTNGKCYLRPDLLNGD